MVKSFFHSAGICLFILMCAACASATPTDIIHPTPSPIGLPTTARPTTSIPTTTASPTPTIPRPRPTATLTPAPTIPGDWQVPVVSLPDGDNYLPGYLEWKETGLLSIPNFDDITFLIDPTTGQVVSTAAPTPAPGPENASIPPSADVWIVCDKTGVTMLRSADQSVLARSPLHVTDCPWSIQWASDSSAAALVTDQGEVYLWLPDGSEPKKLGQAALDSFPAWSPDNTQILLSARLKGNDDPSLRSFTIAYRDGRPMFEPNTPMDASNNWMPYYLEWVNDAVISSSIHGNYYNYVDYYDARTGRFIIRNAYADGGGHEAQRSPDGHWLILEVSPGAVNWEKRWETYPFQDMGLVIVDLETLRRSLVIQSTPPEESARRSGNDSFKFLGWNDDSSLFYLLHFPVGGPEYDLPTGLLRLYPKIGYTEQVVPNVAYGRLSSDNQHIFLVTAETITEDQATGVQAVLYRLDGTPVTKLQPVADRLEYGMLNEIEVYERSYPPLIPSRWSPGSDRLAYIDPQGNLWILDTSGAARLIAANLPTEDWYERVWFDWSDDGRFLFIQRGANTWIAQVPHP